jgi:hypothetical protein
MAEIKAMPWHEGDTSELKRNGIPPVILADMEVHSTGLVW